MLQPGWKWEWVKITEGTSCVSVLVNPVASFYTLNKTSQVCLQTSLIICIIRTCEDNSNLAGTINLNMVLKTTHTPNTQADIHAQSIITNEGPLLLFSVVCRDLSVLVNQPCQPWQSSRCLLLPQRWQEGQEERKSGGIEREECPRSDNHYSGTSTGNQIQSTELATLTSANKVDSTPAVLQGIPKVCEKLACWWA